MVVLDLGLPDMDGVEVIKGLRGWTRVPILVLSARHTSDEKVEALDAGADDYVTKPFGMDELLARLRAAVRRAEPTGGGDEDEVLVETEEFTVDLAAKKVQRDGRDVRLTPTEWHLLEVLVRNTGRLVSQKQLLQEVWGPSYGTETNYLRVYMAQLRRKLEADPVASAALHHRAGHGVPLRDAEPRASGARVPVECGTPVRFRYECCPSFREAGGPVPADARPALLLAGGPGLRGAARGRRDRRLHPHLRLPRPPDRRPLLVPCARSPCGRGRESPPWRPSCSTAPPPWTWCGSAGAPSWV